MQPNEAQPYAFLDLDPWFHHITSDRRLRSHAGAATFDRANDLLYVMEPVTDDDKSFVHVWQMAPLPA